MIALNGPQSMTGAELRAWRRSQRITQEQAAEWWTGNAGKVRSWRRWERGESRIPAALVKRVRAMQQPPQPSV